MIKVYAERMGNRYVLMNEKGGQWYFSSYKELMENLEFFCENPSALIYTADSSRYISREKLVRDFIEYDLEELVAENVCYGTRDFYNNLGGYKTIIIKNLEIVVRSALWKIVDGMGFLPADSRDLVVWME